MLYVLPSRPPPPPFPLPATYAASTAHRNHTEPRAFSPAPAAHARLPRRPRPDRHDAPRARRRRHGRGQRRQHGAALRLGVRAAEGHPHAAVRRRVAAGPQRVLVDAHLVFQHGGGRGVFQEPGRRVREEEGGELARGEGEEGGWWGALGDG